MHNGESKIGWCVHTMILHVHLFCGESENISGHIIMNEAYGDLFELYNLFSDPNPSVFLYAKCKEASTQGTCTTWVYFVP